MTIGFAILPDNDTYNYIRGLQLRLNRELGIRMSRQSPHITIKSPFETEDISAHMAYLEDLASQIKPFEIRFSDFKTFGRRVLYLAVSKNPVLMAIHYSLLSDMEEKFGVSAHEFEGENVVFHASIAGFNLEDDIEKAKDYLRQYADKPSFIARELGVFYDLGGGEGWIILKRIRFS